MKIIIKNSSMEFQIHNDYPIQSETIEDGKMNSWFALPVPAESGQKYRVRIVSIGGATWDDAAAVIGFASSNSTYAVEPNQAVISHTNVGTYFTVTLAADLSYLYVYLPTDLRSYSVVVEAQRIS